MKTALILILMLLLIVGACVDTTRTDASPVHASQAEALLAAEDVLAESLSDYERTTNFPQCWSEYTTTHICTCCFDPADVGSVYCGCVPTGGGGPSSPYPDPPLAPEPQVDPPAVDSADQLKWMIGTWDCSSAYFPLPPFIELHTAVATYTITEDVSAQGAIVGDYIETSTDKHGIPTVSIGEQWTIGSHEAGAGSAGVSIESLSSDGSLISSTGIVRGQNGPTTGLLSLSGKIQFQDLSVRNWGAFMIASGKDPDRLSVSRRIEIGPGSEQQYFTASCSRRAVDVDEQARITAAAIAASPTTGVSRQPTTAERAGLEALLGGPVTQESPGCQGGTCCWWDTANPRGGFCCCSADFCYCHPPQPPAPNNPPSTP